jgi:hypothetical protein
MVKEREKGRKRFWGRGIVVGEIGELLMRRNFLDERASKGKLKES